jgi:hypothetical protein
MPRVMLEQQDPEPRLAHVIRDDAGSDQLSLSE